jgi:hypothetical protein
MWYKFVDWNEIEPYRGALRRIRRELGISAFGINLHETPRLGEPVTSRPARAAGCRLRDAHPRQRANGYRGAGMLGCGGGAGIDA